MDQLYSINHCRFYQCFHEAPGAEGSSSTMADHDAAQNYAPQLMERTKAKGFMLEQVFKCRDRILEEKAIL